MELRIAVCTEWAGCRNIGECEEERLGFGRPFKPFSQVGGGDAGVGIAGDVLDGQCGGKSVGADNLIGVDATWIEQKGVQG